MYTINFQNNVFRIVLYVAPTLSGIEKLSTVLQQVMKQPIVVLSTYQTYFAIFGWNKIFSFSRMYPFFL